MINSLALGKFQDRIKQTNYTYSLDRLRSEFENYSSIITLRCPKHGTFHIKFSDFVLKEYRCLECVDEHISSTMKF